MKYAVLFLAAFIAVAPTLVSGVSVLPRPTGFVVDAADVLSSADEAALAEKLTAFEQSSAHEIAVAIIPSLDGDTIEGYALRLFDAWGIGKAKADNGVLILVALEEREMRIEVGYGLEGALTDAQSYWIIQNSMKPAFQAGNFADGLNAAVDKIIAATQGEIILSATDNQNPQISKFISDAFYFIPFVFVWFASILGRSKSWWAGGVAGGVFGIILGAIFGFLYIGIVSILILIPLGFFFDFVV